MPTEPPSEQSVSKAVVTVAGLGTRFLPVTKATPKEMLPIVDKPAIQYVVEEAVSVGLTDVLLVTGRNKNAIENHFDHNWELEAALEAKGDDERLRRVRASSVLADLHYTRQGDPRGLGHAVLCAARHVGKEPIAVLLGDDLIDPRDPMLSTRLAVRDRQGGSVVALMRVPRDQVNLYGCAAVQDSEDPDAVTITDLVEKPPVDEAPSELAIIGRYVLDPGVFAVLRETDPGRGGEVQLTDALLRMARTQEHGPVHGVVFTGRRYDTGDRLEYLKTVVRLAAEREDLGPDFSSWLREFVASQLDKAPATQPVDVADQIAQPDQTDREVAR
jgi:UTP--glucose-1-phosphate uridylyltransferase